MTFTDPIPLALPQRRRAWALLPMALFLVTAAALMPAAPALASTTGSGKAATEARTPGGAFEAIAMRGSIDLQVRQAARESITVTADDNLLPLLETVVEGGTLQIRFKRGESVRTKTQPKVVVEVVRLNALSSAGSGDMLVEGLQTPALKISIAGSSDAVLRGVQTESLEVSVAGSGDVRGEGTARQVKVSIAGSGDVNLGGMETDEARVSIAGSGDATVTANKALQATIAGSGDLTYRGNPATLKTSVMGSGSIQKR